MALVFVVEDDPDLGPQIHASLEAGGHEAVLFQTATAALASHERQPADVLVLDMIIKVNGRVAADGGLNAIFRARELSARDEAQPLIIAMSGASSFPDVSALLTTANQLGADAVLEKPFAPTRLLNAIQKGLDGNLTVNARGEPED